MYILFSSDCCYGHQGQSYYKADVINEAPCVYPKTNSRYHCSACLRTAGRNQTFGSFSAFSLSLCFTNIIPTYQQLFQKCSNQYGGRQINRITFILFTYVFLSEFSLLRLGLTNPSSLPSDGGGMVGNDTWCPEQSHLKPLTIGM